MDPKEMKRHRIEKDTDHEGHNHFHPLCNTVGVINSVRVI